MGNFKFLDTVSGKDKLKYAKFLQDIKKKYEKGDISYNEAQGFLNTIKSQQIGEGERTGYRLVGGKKIPVSRKPATKEDVFEKAVESDIPLDNFPIEEKEETKKPKVADIYKTRQIRRYLRKNEYSYNPDLTDDENVFNFLQHKDTTEGRESGDKHISEINKIITKKKVKPPKEITPEEARKKLITIADDVDFMNPESKRDMFIKKEKMREVPDLINALPVDDQSEWALRFGLVAPDPGTAESPEKTEGIPAGATFIGNQKGTGRPVYKLPDGRGYIPD
jgi:hypothetical protein